MRDIRKLKTRIEAMAKHSINALSPTISPAPKSVARNEIESIYEGLKYYISNGVSEFVLQKKYMGSYCDVYLSKELDHTYLVSRNGFKIKVVDQENITAICKNVHSCFDWSDKSMVIIQAELMPWYALGANLVENEYKAYLYSHQNHLDYLKSSNLYAKLELVNASNQYLDLKDDLDHMEEKTLKKKYPSHIVRQYQSVHDFIVKDLDVYSHDIEVFESQLNHYGKESPLELKPFNVLKIVYDNGDEEIPNDNLSYASINTDDFRHLIISTLEELDQTIDEISEWYDGLAVNMEEGIMIKPRKCFIKNLPPALKVRNTSYLTLIYGLDFNSKYGYYMKRRNIAEKLRCSIQDWMINHALLQVKYNTIDAENYYYKNLIYDRIMQEEIETRIDHRL